MKDTLEILNEFSANVCEALNGAGVRGGEEDEDLLCALMLVVGRPESGQPPIGASLNFDHETQLWESTAQATEAEVADF